MPPLPVDVVVSWLAAAAILVYLLTLRRPETRSPLESKLLFLLVCLGSLFAIRGFFWIFGGIPLKILTFLPATLLPLAATLFFESLLRRHAARILKLFVLGGTALAFAGNLALHGTSRWIFFRGFTVFLIATLVWLFWMVLRRDRNALSPTENATINGLTAAIVFAVLVSLTDFQLRPAWLDLRIGGLGGLVFVYTSVRLVGSAERTASRELGAILVGTVALAASMTLLVDETTTTTWIEATALAMAFVLVFAIVDRLRSLARIERGGGLRRWLLEADLETLEGFLRSLDRLPLTERHLILEASSEELEPFDTTLMASAFDANHPVWTIAQLRSAPPRSDLDPMATEQLLALLESFGLRQITLVSRSPCRFLLLSFPEVASAREWLQDLAIVHRIALSLDRGTSR